MLWRITAQYESTCTKSWQYTLQCIMVQLSEIGSFVSGYALLSQFYSFGSHFHQQSCRLPEGLKLRTKAAECTLMLLVKVLQAVKKNQLQPSCVWLNTCVNQFVNNWSQVYWCMFNMMWKVSVFQYRYQYWISILYRWYQYLPYCQYSASVSIYKIIFWCKCTSKLTFCAGYAKLRCFTSYCKIHHFCGEPN